VAQVALWQHLKNIRNLKGTLFLFVLGLGSCGEVLTPLSCMLHPESGVRHRSGYIYPTAIFAVELNSAQESEAMLAAITSFARMHGLKRYRPVEVPFFREQNLKDPRKKLEQQTYWNPPQPECQMGFGVSLLEFSRQCAVVQFHDHSGVWRQGPLEAFKQFPVHLDSAIDGPSHLLVHPKPEQNFPAS
jgi:hypothetical protein